MEDSMPKESRKNRDPHAPNKGQDKAREMMKTEFGGFKRKKLMDRYYPHLMEYWSKARGSMLDRDYGGLTMVERELIVLGMEICMRHRDVECHTVLSMRAGATAQQVAAVVGICMAMHGLYSFDERGSRALRTAEECEADLDAAYRHLVELRGGYESSMKSHDTPY